MIKRTVVTTLLVVTASTGALAQPSRWVEIGGNDEITAYADVQSMQKIGPKVKVWLKWINALPIETTTIFPRKTFLSEKTLAAYHCVDRTSATLQVIRYANTDATGEVVETLYAQETSSAYRAVAPETIGESILSYACKANPSRQK
jgi:hypothetical protein